METKKEISWLIISLILVVGVLAAIEADTSTIQGKIIVIIIFISYGLIGITMVIKPEIPINLFGYEKKAINYWVYRIIGIFWIIIAIRFLIYKF